MLWYVHIIIISVSVSFRVSMYNILIVPDPCLSSPCDPNAECTRDGLQLNTFTCSCVSPYEGNGFNCTCKLMHLRGSEVLCRIAGNFRGTNVFRGCLLMKP